MKKFVLAPALAALAMFVFGAIYWMSPFPYKVLTPVTDNAAAAAALGQLFPTTGTYIVPGPEMKDQKLLEELWRRGPSAEVRFIREGHEMMEPAVMVKGYLHYFAVALLLALLLGKAVPTDKGYGCRVKFCGFVGLLAAIAVPLSDSIWWHHAWGWPLMTSLYTVLEFVVAGLVLGIFLRAPTPAAGHPA